MILNCTTKNNKDVIAEGYMDKPCQEAATDLTPLRDGELAMYGTRPFSMYYFFIIMAVLAYLSM